MPSNQNSRCMVSTARFQSIFLTLTLLAMQLTTSVQAMPHIETMNSCGTSMTITVTCLVDSTTKQVLDLWLENADGESSTVCDMDDMPGTTRMMYNLAPGDSIYGVQACYKNGGLAGVTFSSAGGPLICGKPQDPDVICKSTVVKDPAPMSAIYGHCSGDGIIELEKVCFNPFYINPVIPVTGCPPGQGRSSAQEPCQPCRRNFYNPGGLKAECLRCPSGLATISEGASRCGCPPGYGANPNFRSGSPASGPECVLCAPGTYYPGGNIEPCWRCRGSAFLTTPPGASSIVQCVCRPGYGASIDAPNTCQPCPKGTWSNSLADVPPSQPLNSLVRFPPGVGNGKGKGGCYTCNPSWKECTSCCEASTRTCTLTTSSPASTSPNDCKPVVFSAAHNKSTVLR